MRDLCEEVKAIGERTKRRRQRACDLIASYDSYQRLAKSKVAAVRFDAQRELMWLEKEMETFVGCAACDGKAK